MTKVIFFFFYGRPHREKLSSHTRPGAQPAYCIVKDSALPPAKLLHISAFLPQAPLFRGFFCSALGIGLPQEPMQNLFIKVRRGTLKTHILYSDSVFRIFPLRAFPLVHPHLPGP